jgi:oligoendopeptidase F
MARQLARGEVPVELTWNLADIYPDEAAWNADYERVIAALPKLAAYRGRLGESATTLLAFLEARDAAAERYAKVRGYAHLGISTDGLSPTLQAMAIRSGELSARVGEALSFVTGEIAGLPAGTVEGFLAAEPRLDTYRFQLESLLARRGHVLSPQTEAALAALDDVLDLPEAVWNQSTAADFAAAPVADGEGSEVSVTIARWVFGLSKSPDRDLRRRAYQSLGAAMDARKHTLATALATNVKRNVSLARLRGYNSAAEMILAPQRVPDDVYRMILRVVHDGMAPHARKLARLRQRVLGLDAVHHYDLEAPLDPAFDAALDYAGCARLIKEGLSVLGSEYGAILDAALGDRWIDRADNVGKRSGAFCSDVYGVHPYVFTTWQDQLRSALVLAHELGHCGHGELSARAQAISNADPFATGAFTGLGVPLFFVEGPSTANEMLMGRHLLATTTDPRRRRFIIEQFLGTFTHNMITHLLEGRFEQRLYDLVEAGRPLTTNAILDVQAETFATFWGDAVVLDDEAKLYWAQQPHFYYGLYSFTYSAGLAGGVAVADSIQREGQPAVDRWLEVLRLGGKLPPIELAARAGVDLTSPVPFERAVSYFGELVDELETAYI